MVGGAEGGWTRWGEEVMGSDRRGVGARWTCYGVFFFIFFFLFQSINVQKQRGEIVYGPPRKRLGPERRTCTKTPPDHVFHLTACLSLGAQGLPHRSLSNTTFNSQYLKLHFHAEYSCPLNMQSL